jgi:hypothetical protein
MKKKITPAPPQKQLEKRKQVYRESYRKGVFFDNKEKLIEWLRQKDVIVRVHAGGRLDDDTELIQITIEGFIPD